VGFENVVFDGNRVQAEKTHALYDNSLSGQWELKSNLGFDFKRRIDFMINHEMIS